MACQTRASLKYAGVWGLHFGPGAQRAEAEHEFMVISFEKSTYVYRFKAGSEPKVVSDSNACGFATDCETKYACTMFDGEGIVQVRAALGNLTMAVLKIIS
jgi:hypothetical protein